MSGSRFDKLPLRVYWRENLQTPLLTKKESQGANISVLIVPDVGIVHCLSRIAEEDESSIRIDIIAVVLLKAAVGAKSENVR